MRNIHQLFVMALSFVDARGCVPAADHATLSFTFNDLDTLAAIWAGANP